VLEGATIVVFADDWGVHPSSAQHLIRRFLGKNRVIWFNTTGLRPPRANLYDIRKLLHKVRHWTGLSTAGFSPCEGKVLHQYPEIHEIPLLPLQWGSSARKVNAWILRRAVRRCLPKSHSGQPLFIVTTLPLTADLVGAIPGATFIYYLVDDYASWPGFTGKLVREMDQEQAQGADRILVASRALAELHEKIATRIEHLPHGVDVHHFSIGRNVRAQRKRGGIKSVAEVIFFGAIDERIDHDIFNAVIRARPRLRFLCIGPQTSSKDRLAFAPNLRRCPPVPFSELPQLLGQCEVAFMPYVQSYLGQRLAPLKALEALTAGLPVVGTDIPELRTLPGGAILGKTLNDFISGLDQTLRGGLPLPSLEDLAAHSWENRAERLSKIMVSAGPSHTLS